MREHDFSQLPYRHDELGWIFVTREQVSRWLEAETDDDGTALTDLTMPVSTLADRADVGAVHPRLLGPDATLSEALKSWRAPCTLPTPSPAGMPSCSSVARNRPPFRGFSPPMTCRICTSCLAADASARSVVRAWGQGCGLSINNPACALGAA